MRKKFNRYARRLAEKLHVSQERPSSTTGTSKINGNVESVVVPKTLKVDAKGKHDKDINSSNATQHHSNDNERAKESHSGAKSIRKLVKSSCDKSTTAGKVLSSNPITNKKSASMSLAVLKKVDAVAPTTPLTSSMAKRKSLTETNNTDNGIDTKIKSKSIEVKQSTKIAGVVENEKTSGAPVVVDTVAVATTVVPKPKPTKAEPVVRKTKRRTTNQHETVPLTTDAVPSITIVHNMKMGESTKRRATLAPDVSAEKPPDATPSSATKEMPERIVKTATDVQSTPSLVTRLSTKETQTSRDSSPQIPRRTPIKLPTTSFNSKRTPIELPGSKKETCPNAMVSKRQQLTFEEALLQPLMSRSRSSSASSVTHAKPVNATCKLTQAPESPTTHRNIEFPADVRSDPKMFCARVDVVRYDFSKLSSLLKLTFPMKRKRLDDDDGDEMQQLEQQATIAPTAIESVIDALPINVKPRKVKRLKTENVHAKCDEFVVPAVPSIAASTATTSGSCSFTPKSILQSSKHSESNKMASPAVAAATESPVSVKKSVKFCERVDHVDDGREKPIVCTAPCQMSNESQMNAAKLLSERSSETVELVSPKNSNFAQNVDNNNIAMAKETIAVLAKSEAKSAVIDTDCDKQQISIVKNVSRRKRGRPGKKDMAPLHLPPLVQPVQLVHFPTMISSSSESTFDKLPSPTIISAAEPNVEHTPNGNSFANANDDDKVTKSPECIFGLESPQFSVTPTSAVVAATTVVAAPATAVAATETATGATSEAKRKHRRTKKHPAGDLKFIIRSSSESQSEIVRRESKLKRRKARGPKELMHFRLKSSGKPYQGYRQKYGEQMFNAAVRLLKDDPVILEYLRHFKIEIKEEKIDSEDDNKSTHSGSGDPGEPLSTTLTAASLPQQMNEPPPPPPPPQQQQQEEQQQQEQEEQQQQEQQHQDYCELDTNETNAPCDSVVDQIERNETYQPTITNAPNYYYPTEDMHISARNIIAAASIIAPIPSMPFESPGTTLGSHTPTYTSNAIESMYNTYMQPTPPYDSPSSGSGATAVHPMAPLFDTAALVNIQPTPPYEPQATNIDGITILSNEKLPPLKVYSMPISRMQDSLEQSFSDVVYMSGVPETLQEIPAEEVLEFLSSQNDETANNLLMSKNSVNDDIEMGMETHANKSIDQQLTKSLADNPYFDPQMHGQHQQQQQEQQHSQMYVPSVHNNAYHEQSSAPSVAASPSPSLPRAVSMSSLLTGAVRTKASLKQMDDGYRMNGITDDLYNMNPSMDTSNAAFSYSDESLSSKLIRNENPLLNNGRGSNSSLDESTFAMCTSSNHNHDHQNHNHNNNNDSNSQSNSVQSSPIMHGMHDDASTDKNGELGITFSTPTKQNNLQFDMEDSIIDEVLMNGDEVFMNGDDGQIEKYCLELANSQNILCERD